MPTNKDYLKIGLVFDDSLDKPDGVQQYILSIGQWLSGQGHDVHFLVGSTARQDLANVHSLSRNINVRFNGNRMSMPLPTSKRNIKTFLELQNFDVLHVQLPYSPYLAHRIIKAAGNDTAIIGTFHIFAEGWLAITGTKLLKLWLNSSLKRFDNIVSVSKAAADFADKNFGIKTNILPNVIDYQRFASAQPLEKYDDNVLNILFLGRLVPRKGCMVLLEAINLIKFDNTLPKFRVLLCGKGPLAPKLVEYSNKNRLNQLVEFVGFVSEDDKPKYYASADISVFPSSGGESFGIVLLEAMACGKSDVLAGNNPGYSSVIYDNSEQLFDPLDAQKLAVKIRQHLMQPEIRIKAQKWGQEYSATFDTKIVGAKLLEIYHQALRKRLVR